MRSISEYVGKPLSWEQTEILKREYELRYADEGVAALKWEKMFGSLASARCADGEWTLKRAGFLRPHVTVRREGSDENLASFEASWFGAGRVAFTGGDRFEWVQGDFWAKKWAFENAHGVQAVTFKSRLLKAGSAADVEISSAVHSAEHLAVLVMLGWYLMVLMADDSAAAVVAAM